MRRLALFAFLMLAIFPMAATAAPTILDTRHNLSATGPGDVRALSEDRVCIFCHTPHGARPVAPLWNRQDPATAYIPYDSPTLHAAPGQPTGASKLCLSCHDGTIAMGDLLSESSPIPMTFGAMPEGGGLIGTDLRDDHPISFDYLEALSQTPGTLRPPSAWDPRIQLDAGNELQCTSCHDPHDDRWGDFLVMDNRNALLCRQCHQQDEFMLTPHALAAASWNGAGGDPWPHTDYGDVQSNACMNCHYAHHAGGPEELLRSPQEEQNCFVCHNGNVAAYNLQADFDKAFRHPLDARQGAHEAGESPLDAAGHVECADCHDPHRARLEPAEAPLVMGALYGASGISLAGAPLDEAAYEYEVCLKCHSDESSPMTGIARQVPSGNLRLQIAPSSPSFHPIAAPGKNSDVPSLIAPLSAASMIYCSHCHTSDSAQPNVIGSNGPHGSRHEYLLAREYRTGGEISESPAAYALCYGCHSRESILGDESFSEHRQHILEERTPCSTCHDPHGIDQRTGSPAANAHLINFDLAEVEPDPVTGRLEYESQGPGMGRCYLNCHGEVHSPAQYP